MSDPFMRYVLWYCGLTWVQGGADYPWQMRVLTGQRTRAELADAREAFLAGNLLSRASAPAIGTRARVGGAPRTVFLHRLYVNQSLNSTLATERGLREELRRQVKEILLKADTRSWTGTEWDSLPHFALHIIRSQDEDEDDAQLPELATSAGNGVTVNLLEDLHATLIEDLIRLVARPPNLYVDEKEDIEYKWPTLRHRTLMMGGHLHEALVVIFRIWYIAVVGHSFMPAGFPAQWVMYGFSFLDIMAKLTKLLVDQGPLRGT
jgi:hypothetical protein